MTGVTLAITVPAAASVGFGEAVKAAVTRIIYSLVVSDLERILDGLIASLLLSVAQITSFS